MEKQTTLPQPTSTRRSDVHNSGDAASPSVNWSRRHPFIQVSDANGVLWNVHEARATKHGFDLLFGRPADSHLDGIGSRGKPQLIATPALLAYWDEHRHDTGAIRNLPAASSTLGRVRREHRFNFITDRRSLWQERAPDFKTLTNNQFAERHNIHPDVANEWRMRFFGRSARPLNWWHDPAVLELLRGPLNNSDLAAKLGLERSYAARLRKLALTTSDEDLVKPPAPAKPRAQSKKRTTRWETAEAVAILRSPITGREAAEKLGISESHALRLRHLLASANQLIAA